MRRRRAGPKGPVLFASCQLAGCACTPHSFSSWRKRMRRARWKKKPPSPNLPVRASLGMRTVVGHDRIKPAGSHPSALYLGNHPAFKPQVVTLAQIPGCLSKRPTFSPAAAPLGVFPKRGPRPPLLVVLRGGLEGEIEIPLQCLSLTGRGRFSLQERNGGAYAHLHRGVRSGNLR